jgi:uncharacterized membrane protein YphA (DoxX/SURF4 family)
MLGRLWHQFTNKIFLDMKNALVSWIFGSAQPGSRTFEWAYALFRFYCGISMAIGAGWSKVFHKINPDSGTEAANMAFGVPDWFVKQVGEIGFTVISPSFWAHLAVYGEFVGGLLIAVGLLTRLSAVQMAVQFAVVSFVWYDEPELFGMYYQQLIFWSFVLIAAVGDGRFSVANGIRWARTRSLSVRKMAVVASLFLPLLASAQTSDGLERVRFSVTNPSLRGREVDFKFFEETSGKRAGYGYHLNGFESHAVNLPAGTRIYKKKNDQWNLLWVVSKADEGREIDVTKQYELSREQWLESARAEMAEQTNAYDSAAGIDADENLRQWAEARNLSMVTLVVSGKSLVGATRHVRVQLPGDPTPTNLGFSRRISRFDRLRVSYPVGSKIYLCDEAYWKSAQPVREKLLFEVTEELANYRIRI